MSITSLEYKFVADEMVGKLARFLRLLGFDTYYKNEISDRELIKIALAENRLILTRDTKLIEKDIVREYVLISSDDPEQQLKQAIKDLNLKIEQSFILSRCLECNYLLETVDKHDIAGKVWPYVYSAHDNFKTCPNCDRIYWEGTHVSAMRKRLKDWDLL